MKLEDIVIGEEYLYLDQYVTVKEIWAGDTALIETRFSQVSQCHIDELTPKPPRPAKDAQTTMPAKAQCRNCGAEFSKLKDGKIPTHDFPPPCRSVCRGSGQAPKDDESTPLWKDDASQEAKDTFGQIRLELLIYGFAAVKSLAQLRGDHSGTMECPLCLKQVRFTIAPSNGHCAAKCETPKCIAIRE